MQTGYDDRTLQRELRYYCIMGSNTRPFMAANDHTAPPPMAAPDILVNQGLVDASGAVTPKGHDFMRA